MSQLQYNEAMLIAAERSRIARLYILGKITLSQLREMEKGSFNYKEIKSGV